MQGISDLADIERIEAIELSQRNLPSSTYELVARSAEKSPLDPAIHFFLSHKDLKNSKSISYKEFLASITSTSNLLRKIGVERNSTVSILLPNLPQTCVSILAAETAGIASPLNPILEVSAIKGLISASNSNVVLCLAPLPGTDIYDKTIQALSEIERDFSLITVDLKKYLGAIKRFGLGLAKKKLKLPTLPANVELLGDFDELSAKENSESLDFSDLPQHHDRASLFHTGGTTGGPKLAIHSQLNEVANTWMATIASGVEDEKSVFFCGLPYFHVNAFTVTGLVPWSNGGSVVIGTPRGYRGEGVISNFWEIASHFKINYFSGVPTIYSRLLQNIPEGIDLSSIKYALCGAAPLSQELATRFEKTTGITLLEGYGLTEATCVVSINPSLGARKVGSVGIRLPYSELKIALTRDGNYLRDAEAGEIGRVLLKGPHVFEGYLNSSHNDHVWFKTHINESESWLDTGDLGYLDEDDFLWLTGRSKDIIIRGGHNIDPSSIESILEKHKDVEQAVVIGRPHADLGEVPVAFVKLIPGHSTSSLELTIYSRQKIQEKQAIPENIQIVEEFPLTQIGKVHRPSLRSGEIKLVFEDTLSKIEGISTASVTVGPDSENGTRADLDITIKPGVDYAQIQKQISASLSNFAIFYTTRLTT